MSEKTLIIYTHAIEQRKRVPLKDNDGTSVATIIKSLERDCDVSHLHNYGLLLRNTQKTRYVFDDIATTCGRQIPDVFKLKALPNHLSEGGGVLPDICGQGNRYRAQDCDREPELHEW